MSQQALCRGIVLSALMGAVFAGWGACSGTPAFNRAGLGDAGSDRPDQGGAGEPDGLIGTGGAGDEPLGTGGVVGGGGSDGGVGGQTGAGGGGGSVPATGSGGAGAGGGAGTGGGAGAGGTRPPAGGSAGMMSGGSGGGGGRGGTMGTGGSTNTGGVPGSGGAGGPGGSGGGANGSGGSAGAGGRGGGAGGASGTGGAGTGGSGPRIISIDFTGGPAAAPGPEMTVTEIAGVKPATHWNNATGVMGSLTDLVAFGGGVTPADLTWASPANDPSTGMWQIGYPDLPGNQRMMNGYLDPTIAASPATISVTGLPTSITSAGYDVYVYVLGDPGADEMRTYTYSITGVAGTFSVRQNGPTDETAFPGFMLVSSSNGFGNYFVYRNLRGSSFTLTATPTGPANRPRSPVNGIQIVSPSGS